jgi:hypothetical protein
MASSCNRVKLICGNAKYLKDHAYNITNSPDLKDIIDVVKKSTTKVEQIVQVPPSLQDTRDHHGIKKQRVVPIKQHWQQLRSWKPGNNVIYNNNAAVLLFVRVSMLSRFLRGNQPTSDDEVHLCTDMYEKGQTAATDVLLGSAGSFSNWHQDGPLWSDSGRSAMPLRLCSIACAQVHRAAASAHFWRADNPPHRGAAHSLSAAPADAPPPPSADVIVVEGSKFIAVVPVSRKAQAFIADIRGGRQKGQRAEHFQDKAWLAKVAAAGGVVAHVTGPCALRIKAEHWHCVVNVTTCVRWEAQAPCPAAVPLASLRAGWAGSNVHGAACVAIHFVVVCVIPVIPVIPVARGWAWLHAPFTTYHSWHPESGMTMTATVMCMLLRTSADPPPPSPPPLQPQHQLLAHG